MSETKTSESLNVINEATGQVMPLTEFVSSLLADPAPIRMREGTGQVWGQREYNRHCALRAANEALQRMAESLATGEPLKSTDVADLTLVKLFAVRDGGDERLKNLVTQALEPYEAKCILERVELAKVTDRVRAAGKAYYAGESKAASGSREEFKDLLKIAAVAMGSAEDQSEPVRQNEFLKRLAACAREASPSYRYRHSD
jgi:hypothetical protein